MNQKRTFEGIVYEWSQNIAGANPQRKFRGITLLDINSLKRMLRKEYRLLRHTSANESLAKSKIIHRR